MEVAFVFGGVMITGLYFWISCLFQFWPTFDYNLYTMWEATYKYNDENTIGWKTANLIGGFLQRLEEARKVGYGVVVMTGDSAPFCLSACFMFKYKEVPTFVKDSADYDSYDFKQIDISMLFSILLVLQ